MKLMKKRNPGVLISLVFLLAALIAYVIVELHVFSIAPAELRSAVIQEFSDCELQNEWSLGRSRIFTLIRKSDNYTFCVFFPASELSGRFKPNEKFGAYVPLNDSSVDISFPDYWRSYYITINTDYMVLNRTDMKNVLGMSFGLRFLYASLIIISFVRLILQAVKRKQTGHHETAKA